MTIKCSCCKVLKFETEYSFKNKSKNLRTHKCKSCHSEYAKIHYKNNKSSYISRATLSTKVNRAKYRERMLEYLSDKSCKDCGITDPRVLDFDHIKEKTANVSHMKDNSWNKILEEIAKCEIRCANCHRIKTAKQFNTYKNIKPS